ncbi:hypothetical protein [Aliamphritea spongicola]|nr:hypothetical protein [Aliamphritea spongicola]
MNNKNAENHLGIDHPLVAVRDMDKACEDFARLGFLLTPGTIIRGD